MTPENPHPHQAELGFAARYITNAAKGKTPPIAHVLRRMSEGENIDPHRPQTAWHPRQRPPGAEGKYRIPDALRLAAGFAEERGRQGDKERAERMRAAADQLDTDRPDNEDLADNEEPPAPPPIEPANATTADNEEHRRPNDRNPYAGTLRLAARTINNHYPEPQPIAAQMIATAETDDHLTTVPNKAFTAGKEFLTIKQGILHAADIAEDEETAERLRTAAADIKERL